MSPIKVLLVDDHPVVREGLRSFLATCPGVLVVGEAGDGLEAVRLARELRPDVVLMDVALPALDGLEATRQLASAAPAVKVLLLTVSAEPEYLREAARAGACGYLLKDASPSELLKALEAVHEGGAFQTAGSSEALRASIQGAGPPAVELTAREREVLRGVLEGGTSRAVAARLGISVRTVECHRMRLRRKLGARSSAELARRALEIGLMSRTTKATDP